ncbi:MAG: hypothetical protein J7500_13705 [Sphingomonas sp.]|uniref:hypothetical protein n=1 Tax=Sphingomonas sp. TaxID=28214 RepID=UPI001B0133B8|nr:hypothetical protein [Sphingomonas sp.]MBO9623757.1 hypothetical protein [Sphingomonas sp.]
MRRGSFAALALTTALVPFPIGGAQASGGGGAVGGEGLHLVPMDEVSVPIVDADRVAGALRFKLVLDARDDATAARMTAQLPALRATTVAAALEFARLNASGLRAVDAQQLDHDLTAALQSGEPGLARVLIVEVAASRS